MDQRMATITKGRSNGVVRSSEVLYFFTFYALALQSGTKWSTDTVEMTEGCNNNNHRGGGLLLLLLL